MLLHSGAEVVGFSLPQYPRGIAEMLRLDDKCEGLIGDIRHLLELEEALREYAPEIVFHLAAQPLVLPSFEDPIGTLSTNVIGTANVLDAVRHQPSVRACVVITSDKCYATSSRAHDESDPFGGDDLYSASKGAAEIVVHAYRQSFFRQLGVPVASARAGNIVGGGDWAQFRIVPDSIRAIRAGESVRLRRPDAVRPWQHVLDAVAGYLRLGDALVTRGDEVAEGWNFGPHPDATVTVAELVGSLVENWRALGGEAEDPTIESVVAVVERDYLTLTSSKAEARLGWSSQLNFDSTMSWTAEWYFNANTNEGTTDVTDSQIARFLRLESSINDSAPLANGTVASPASPPRV